MIDTFFGPIAVESLRPGDQVATLEAGLQRLDGIAHARHSAATLDRKLVLLRRGALGRGVPARDTLVTADQMLRVPGNPLARVSSLLDGRSIVLASPRGVLTFVDVLLDLPWTLLANGAPLSAQHQVSGTLHLPRAARTRALPPVPAPIHGSASGPLRAAPRLAAPRLAASRPARAPTLFIPHPAG